MKEIAIFTHSRKIKREARLVGLSPLAEMPRIIKVKTKKDEEIATAIAIRQGKVYVECKGWKIIPLENLIAKCKGTGRIIAVVKSSDEAKLALQTMEVGVDGILLKTEDEKEVGKITKLMQMSLISGKISLEKATVIKIERKGLGHRACIDTCTLMKRGEGMLVGASSQGMLLVQAEVEENELADPRPFRVNAGAVSLYTFAPGNKTRYLEELGRGASALIVDSKGIAEEAVVLRSKIEVRPLVLVEAERQGNGVGAILQNAETIRLVTDKGSKSVTELKPGDNILAHFERGGRHFGMPIKEETIVEK